MQKWEYFRLVIYQEKDKWLILYKEQKVDTSQIISVLNELGDQGWELVTSSSFDRTDSQGKIVPSYMPTYTWTYIYTFKRLKQ
jgi:hypothetical protein